MDHKLKKLQENVDSTNSIMEIQEMIRSEETLDSSKIQVHKVFSNSRNFISLSLTNYENIRNAEIMCSYENMRPVPIHSMKKSIILEEEINIEHVTFVGVQINDDTKAFSEQNKTILAKRYAGFISFLINSYPNAKKLKLQLNEKIRINNNFLIYLMERIKSDKIEVIETLNLHDIIRYGELYNFEHSLMFKEIPCLKKVIVQVHENECYEYILKKKTSIIKKFLYLLNTFSIVNLHLIINDNDKTRSVVDEILNYGETIAMTTSITLNTNWCSGIITNKYKFNNNSVRLVNYLKVCDFEIEEGNDIEKLKIILSECRSLKYLNVNINNENLYKMWGMDYKNAFMELYLDKFRSPIEELNNLCFQTKKSDGDNDLDNFTIEFLESFIKIFPQSVNILYLKNIKSLSLKFFENITNTFYGLETILFSNITNIPQIACFKIYGLKNVIIYDNITLLIPRYVDIVLFCVKDTDVSNEYYFGKMRSTFNVSIRKKDTNNLSFVAFLRSIYNWIDMIELVDEYIINL
uniref:KH domain-containing protein n=1 Tax=Parastrongyloides trichosuri TaxID=131310 RepID=A0A0N4Z826_PARTI